MFTSRIATALLIAATVAGCNKTDPPTPVARPVRTVAVEQGVEGEIVSLTGQIRAKDEVALAFRLDGRMIERPVQVGDRLAAGQVVARLDPQIQQNALRSAEDNLASMEAVLTQTRLALEVRKMAMASLLSDTADVRLAVDSIRQDIQQTRDSIAGFVQNPLNAATERLLVPAALSLLRGLRSKKGQP